MMLHRVPAAAPVGSCRRAEARGAAAADRRHQRKEERELLDELLPRATGGTREARVSSTRRGEGEVAAHRGWP